MSITARTPPNGAKKTTRRVANCGIQTQWNFAQQDLIIVGARTTRFPKPLPLGYLLRYPISILIHIFWLASRGGGDRRTLSSLSTVSKLFHEITKPLKPLKFTLSRSKQIMKPNPDLGTGVGGYRQLIDLPDVAHIQALQNEYPSKRTARVERFRYGRSYSSRQLRLEREMRDQETQVESEDCKVPSWATASRAIIRRPQPPPPGYLLDYPVELLTRIFGLVCIDCPDAGRSICLVSKSFYAAVKPVILSSVRLRKLHQVLGFAHIISTDPIAKVRIRRLNISIQKVDTALFRAERNWDTADNMGSFHWDPSYWGDPDAEYIHELDSSDESEDSYDSSEEMDLEQDIAFFNSPGGQLVGNLPSEGENVQWPMDVGLERAQHLVNRAKTDIIHAVAPVLHSLRLFLRDQQLGITLPVFPKLCELGIRVTLLPALKDHPHTLFPTLETLWITGKLGENHIDLDDLIRHAPVITLIRVPFGRDFLRALIGKLATPSPPNASSIGAKGLMFECIERVHVAYDYCDKIYSVFRRDEASYKKWDSVASFEVYTTADD
ncbi:hypothetical protein BD779DRAFT_115593 [Infundibulicybe gibba]|nr:hypothetical protein BD779DRAFT_115593 [Infundibulicybe gibba]